jgi:hypothetical protein
VLVGGVAEWSNAPVLKTDEGESPPRVRIPVPPPQWHIDPLSLYIIDFTLIAQPIWGIMRGIMWGIVVLGRSALTI